MWKSCLLGIALLANSHSVYGAIALYSFTGSTSGAPTSITSPLGGVTFGNMSIGNTFGTVATPITTGSASSGYAGATGTNNIGNAMRIGPLNTGASGSGFFEWTVSNSTGVELSLDALSFGVRSTGTGSQSITLRSSLDGFASDIGTPASVPNSSAWVARTILSTPFSIGSGVSTTFRLFGFGGAGGAVAGTINTRLDDISITLTAVPEPTSLVGAFGLAACGIARYRGRRRSPSKLWAV